MRVILGHILWVLCIRLSIKTCSRRTGFRFWVKLEKRFYRTNNIVYFFFQLSIFVFLTKTLYRLQLLMIWSTESRSLLSVSRCFLLFLSRAFHLSWGISLSRGQEPLTENKYWGHISHSQCLSSHSVSLNLLLEGKKSCQVTTVWLTPLSVSLSWWFLLNEHPSLWSLISLMNYVFYSRFIAFLPLHEKILRDSNIREDFK